MKKEIFTNEEITEINEKISIDNYNKECILSSVQRLLNYKNQENMCDCCGYHLLIDVDSEFNNYIKYMTNITYEEYIKEIIKFHILDNINIVKLIDYETRRRYSKKDFKNGIKENSIGEINNTLHVIYIFNRINSIFLSMVDEDFNS